MSNVVIVYPRTGFDTKDVSVTLPLAVLSAASGLIGEFDVKIIDQRLTKNWDKILEEELNTNPLCVALSAMTGTQIHYGLEITRFVKKHNPEIPVVWGGMHATLMAEQTLSHPLVDFIIKGEGEFAFRDLVRELANGRQFEKLGGLGWKAKDGGLRINPEGTSLDVNTLPPIPYDLINVEDYVKPSEYRFEGVQRLLPYQGSRGCPYKCTFCSEPVLTKRYRMMKPELIVEQTMALVEKYRLDHITFYDEEFFVNVKWATNIAELINGRYTWYAQTRADDLLRMDLNKLEKCGLRVVAPGLESGSNRILKWIKKQETVEEYIEANQKLAETGIVPRYNFIIGFPGETQEELNQTVDLALRLMEDNPHAVINSFSPLTPLPGTELLNIAVNEYGFKLPENLQEWMAISRRRLPTPWVREKMVVHRNLMYTSVFINNAKRFAQSYWWIPSILFDLYGELIKHRWKQHQYEDTLDVKLARLAHRIFSPVDFMLPTSC